MSGRAEGDGFGAIEVVEVGTGEGFGVDIGDEVREGVDDGVGDAIGLGETLTPLSQINFFPDFIQVNFLP